MILGAHESTAGGLHHAFERAARDHADAVQLWTKSSRQWIAKELEGSAVMTFHQAHMNAGSIPTAAHASYLINLAAPDDTQYERSIEALTRECTRADVLGVAQVIVHPGAAQSLSRESAVQRVAKALQRICRSLSPKSPVRLLLEITAGQGTCVGCTFAELAEMLQRAGEARLGVCLDTQHMFAAGIDWTTPDGYTRVFEEFDRSVGIPHLEAFHLNDSKRPLGARVDRHERIGDGIIGLEPFRRLVRDERFRKLPGFLETPPLANGLDSYSEGLSRLRSLL